MPSSFLIADLETTSKNPLAGEVLTGVFLYCDSELNVLDKYELESRPRAWSTEAEEASKIHGITHAQAMRFRPYQLAATDLLNWLNTLEPSYFCCHANRKLFGKFSSFDYAYLVTYLFDLNYSHYDLYKVCPTRYIISTHSLSSYLNLPCSYDLKSIAQYLGLGEFAHHNAEADAIKCYEILKKLLPQVDLQAFFNYENFKLKDEVLNERSSSASIPGSSKRTTKKPRKLQRNYSGLI